MRVRPRRPNSIGWEHSATPIRRAQAPSALDEKLPAREIERRRKHLMQIQRRISKQKKKALVGRNSTCCSKDHPKKATCCSKAALRCTLRKSTAKSSSTTFPKGFEPQAGRILSLPDHRSPRLRSGRPRSYKRIYGRQAHAQPALSDLQEAGEQQRSPDFPFCSERCRLIDLGKWASGGLRHLLAGSRYISDAFQADYRTDSDED